MNLVDVLAIIPFYLSLFLAQLEDIQGSDSPILKNYS
jgi:hypothetical protein